MNPIKLRFGLLPWSHRYNPIRITTKRLATIALVAFTAVGAQWCYATIQDFKRNQIENQIELKAARAQQAEGKNRLHIVLADPVIRRVMCAK